MLQTPEEQHNCHRLPNRSVRHVSKPRWVARYDGNWAEGGKRVVGLLVPRPTRQSPYGRSFLHFTRDGRLFESKIGYLPGGSHGEWYSARANELPREQWVAIRDFYRNLPPAESA